MSVCTLVPVLSLIREKFWIFCPEIRLQNLGWYWTFFRIMSLPPCRIVMVPEHSEVVVVPLNPVIFCPGLISVSLHFSFVVWAWAPV